MNAVVAADGLLTDGYDGARRALWKFWEAVSRFALSSPCKRTICDSISGNWNLDYSPGYWFFDFFSRIASPYELNPLNINPLKDFLADHINFEQVRSYDGMKLFVAATSVQTGRVRIFDRTELTPDVVMASACLPFIFQAVTIDGQDYWDGGYSGNPPLHPLAYHCDATDVIIVQINPLGCRETPTSAREIRNRVNEITFNAILLRELRAIGFVNRLLDTGRLDPNGYKKMLIHTIAAENGFKDLNASSKMNAEWEFLLHLHDVGCKVADEWLEENFDAIGEKSTLDLDALRDD
jgi:NTE family protein